MPSEVLNAVVKERSGVAEARAPYPSTLGDPGEDEQLFRDMIENVEFTVRGHLSADVDLRDLRLEVCRTRMKQLEVAGKSIPDWLNRLYVDVNEGRWP